MTEAEWVEQMAKRIARSALGHDPTLSVRTGLKVPYGFEIRSYHDGDVEQSSISFQTDLAIIETDEHGRWKPRVIVEAKIRRINTHDAITYSQKAESHKSVHPYLRYGIILGEWGHYPLPGRLYRHGVHFDFMFSFAASEPTEHEMLRYAQLLQSEIEASRTLENIVYKSRSGNCHHYTVLHRRLVVE